MEESDKRVVKNTLYLYSRQAVMLVLGLLTTRIVLDKLGVENYGIYTVVGSFVSMFAILNSVLQSATRRFLSLAIGQGNDKKIHDTFQTAVVLHLWIALIVVVCLESAGLWFLNHELNIEPSRMWAANWVFQFSVLSVAVNIINTPFVAAVTSHERFDVYAYLSIFDVVGKIVVLFLLVVIPMDKLVLYALMIFMVSAAGASVYTWFCRARFSETRHLTFQTDKPLLKEMLKFSGWDSFGNITSIVNVQGLTVLINIFFGALINAARGVANTVTVTVQQFVGGFVVAAEPQLVKFFACGEFDKMSRLVFNISQMTLFMLAILAVPIWMEMHYVLTLWLGDKVPVYTSAFIKITILNCFTTYSNLMVVKAIVATGKVKALNIRLAPIELSILPVMYMALKFGCGPVTVYLLSLIPSFCKFIVNNHLLHKIIGFPSSKYFFNVYVKNLVLVGLAAVLPYMVHCYMEEGLVRFLAVGAVSVACTLTMMWFFALNDGVKNMVLNKIGFRRHAN